MKRIYLLRHALPEAQSQSGRDTDRCLSIAGQHQADALGLVMRERNYRPDYIACSAAVRTRETLAGLSLVGMEGAVDYFEDLYLPQLKTLEDFITLKTPESCHALLLVTHFPGVLDFMQAYGHEQGEFTESSLAVFDCDIEHWHDFDRATTQLADFIDGQRL